MKRQRHTAKHD